MYIVILCPQIIWKHFWNKLLLNTYIVFEHPCIYGYRAVYLDTGVESYTLTDMPLRFALTLNLLPELPLNSIKQQVVGSASVALILNATQQQESTVVTARQESPAPNLKAQSCGPCRSQQWCRHGLAPLHWAALSHLAHLGSALQNPQEARSHMTASKQR